MDLEEALKKAYAKSSGETIRDHTDKLIERLENLKGIYGGKIEEKVPEKYKEVFWDILSLLVEYHDYGKLHSSFQKKIIAKNKKLRKPYELFDLPEVGHNFLSVCFVTDKVLESVFQKLNNKDDSNSVKKVIFQAIAYHHDKWIDKTTYKKIIDEIAEKDFKRFQKSLNLKFWNYIDPAVYLKPEDKDLFNLLVFVKGLLHRLDFTASGEMAVEVDSITDLKDIITKKITKLNSLQEYISVNRDENIIVIASTGMGKTESGALYIGKDKGFFVLPLRASINAIYDRFTQQGQGNELKYGYSNVALLHSTSLFRLMEQKIDNRDEADAINLDFNHILLQYKEARNLSNHLTICTPDQLFPFVFKYAGFERIYATLGYSRIVVDEIQMYNPKMLAFVVKGIQAIKELGGKVLIMTATFPSFLEKKYLNGFEKKEFFLNGIRHKCVIREDTILNIEDLINQAESKKVLIICNTVNRAIEVYDKLIKENPNVVKGLLHSRFIQKHRNLLEEEIKKFAPNKKQIQNTENGIWITTQVAEASLDVDFDILYTELSTIDSLIQRMGRVNRSGVLKIDESTEPNVVVFTEDCSGIGKIYDEEIHKKSLEKLMEKTNNNYDESFDLSESEKINLVKDVFSDIKDSKYMKNFKNAMSIIDEIWNIGKIYNPVETLRQAQEQFREIFNITIIPRDVYNSNEKELKQQKQTILENENIENKYNALKEIYSYTVDVPFYYVKSKEYFCEDIYIADLEYEFDEKSNKGKGLTFKSSEIDDKNIID
jgi:CRISPR-associated endonuclease/helicase Cas3